MEWNIHAQIHRSRVSGLPHMERTGPKSPVIDSSLIKG